MLIALLSNNLISIVECPKLSSVSEIKSKKVVMFCLNNAVYQDQNSGALFDQICLVTTDKTLFFYEAVPIATS